MSGWTDLKFVIAVCWNVSWNVDPLPFSVPDSFAADAPPPDGAVVDDELHAASDSAAAARATPAAATPRTRTRCISEIPSHLPAQSCDQDGLDGVETVFGLVEHDAGARFEDLAGHFQAGGHAGVFHHFPAHSGV